VNERSTTNRWRDGEVIARPRADAREASRIGHFLTWLEQERGLHFDDYDALWEWSVTDLDGFWRSVWDHFGIRSTTEPTAVVADRTMPGTRWFPGIGINYAGQLLAQADERADEVAVVARSQTREPMEVTFGELRDQVARARTGLKALGVGPGDRVAGYLPNIPETLVAFLAAASLGATWSSAAAEFGPRSVIDRFGQIGPKVLLVVGGYRFGSSDIDCRQRVAEIRDALPSVEHVVAVRYGPHGVDGAIDWSDLLAGTEPLEAEPVSFDHPLVILFSSGTTGLPKPIVHGHGGILVEHHKNHALSWDLGSGDRLFWFTTTAWMMWNALVSSLLVGASIVMLDGNPAHPGLEEQWRLASETGATMMGLSPAYLMACRKAGLDPAGTYDLSRLRWLAAAGSPLPGEGYLWVHEQFGRHATLNVGSGGTDVCTGIVQGNPLLPVYIGEMSGRCLGVAARAFDEDGNEVVGQLGELVITEPMPSMPVGLWGDTTGERYRTTYFDQYPGVFRFGDWIRFSEHGSSIITGRSDATLNRGGVRIGTAELYRVVEEHPRIADSLAVHLEDPEGGMGELVLFVAPAEGDEIDDDLKDELIRSLRTELSPRHAPDTVEAVPQVPRNVTGKKLELPVKRILQGAEPATVVSRGAMANPESLDSYLEFLADRDRA
jgi:acetoacetyl-CoA synthetase